MRGTLVDDYVSHCRAELSKVLTTIHFILQALSPAPQKAPCHLSRVTL